MINTLFKFKKIFLIIFFTSPVWILYDIYRIQVPYETILETNIGKQILITNDLFGIIRRDELRIEIERKFVVISVNLLPKNSYYFFNLPMICLSWRRVGYEPIVLIVYSSLFFNTNKLANKTIEYLNLFNVKLVKVKSPPNYEATISMLSRLFVGLLSNVSENDFVITSDSDLYPIDKSYYNYINNNALKVWNAYCCETFNYENKYYRMYPLSHIGMKKHQWKELMKLDNLDQLNGETMIKKLSLKFNKTFYIKPNNRLKKGDSAWFLDQMAISIYISNFINENSDSKLEKIRYKGIRLDRSMTKYRWMRTLLLNYDSITDCHSFQQDALQNWNLLQPLLSKLFNKNLKIIFDKYFKEFNDIANDLLIK